MSIMLDNEAIKYCVTLISPLIDKNWTNHSKVLKGDAVEIAWVRKVSLDIVKHWDGMKLKLLTSMARLLNLLWLYICSKTVWYKCC